MPVLSRRWRSKSRKPKIWIGRSRLCTLRGPLNAPRSRWSSPLSISRSSLAYTSLSRAWARIYLLRTSCQIPLSDSSLINYWINSWCLWWNIWHLPIRVTMCDQQMEQIKTRSGPNWNNWCRRLDLTCIDSNNLNKLSFNLHLTLLKQPTKHRNLKKMSDCIVRSLRNFALLL